MGGAECIVHIKLSRLGQLLRKNRIVGLFFIIIANILQEENVAGLQHAGGLPDLLANAIVNESDRAAEHISKLVSYWPQ